MKLIEEEIQNIIWDNINYFVMLRDLDEQYQQAFDDVVYQSSEKINQLLTQQINKTIDTIEKEVVGKESRTGDWYSDTLKNDYRQEVIDAINKIREDI